MKRKNWPCLTLILGLTLSAQAMEVSGVKLAEKQIVSGQVLRLNGAGIRTATLLKVKVYVASFYAPEMLSTETAVLSAKGPFRFDFTFLRAFNKGKVKDAWTWQFEESGDHSYPNFENDKAIFISAFDAVKDHGVETVEIDGDDTRVYDDGVLRQTIKGHDFQEAFIRLWFGSRPVSPKLKLALLGQSK